MGLSRVRGRVLLGVEALAVEIEVNLAGGLPQLQIVGLATTAVKESRDRVRAALINSGFDFPVSRITVNLAPADLPKDGGRFDLAIAVGILAAQDKISIAALEAVEFSAELALSGELRPVSGIVPTALAAAKAGRALICSAADAEVACQVVQTPVYAARTLLDVFAHLCEQLLLTPMIPQPIQFTGSCPDLAEVKGQYYARRALEVAAAGRHHLLYLGSPGTGKSLLAARLAGILPPMQRSEIETAASVASMLGLDPWPLLCGRRPYRAPHHSASGVALVGGGSGPSPGEISLAHGGVLFLDELPEFPRAVLEMLRQPLENGEVLISRAARCAVFPAHFQLVAAMNPCPCGFFGDSEVECRCDLGRVKSYMSKLSGPLLDRIDLRVRVPRLSPMMLKAEAYGESSACVRERVEVAYGCQLQRQGCANGLLSGLSLDAMDVFSQSSEQLLAEACEKFKLSVRAYDRIRKVALTLSDLAQSSRVEPTHMAEAVGFWAGVR